MSALLTLIPIKDWLYIGAFVLLGAGVAYERHHLLAEGAAHERATVQAASVKAAEAAAKQVATLNSQHIAAIAAIQEKQSVQLKAAAADSATLSQRLRNYQASHSCPGPVLGGAASPDPSAYTGPGRVSGVEAAIEQLIAAAEHDNAVIVAERAERDSLTGK